MREYAKFSTDVRLIPVRSKIQSDLSGGDSLNQHSVKTFGMRFIYVKKPILHGLNILANITQLLIF